MSARNRLVVALALIALGCGGSGKSGNYDRTHGGAGGALNGTGGTISSGGQTIVFDAGPNGGSCDACAPDAGPSAVCGNSLLETGEACDDGNSTPGDGCSGICQVEPNYICPTPGQPCVSSIVCGDG